MRRCFLAAVIAALVAVSGAAGSPGDPPAGLSPVAGSIYRAQFALCSLNRLNAGTVPVRIAATRLALAREKDLGSAAVRGCRNGLLYRHAHDQVVSNLRTDIRTRIAAEKYVAAVYLGFMLLFFLYVLIHAAKVARLDREIRGLLERIDVTRFTTDRP